MLEKAIEKIKSEIDKEKNDPYVKVIGEFLLQHLQENSLVAEKIIQEGKTILKSIEEMAKFAKTKAVNNRAMITDQEGFEIVLKYFGIEFAPLESIQAPVIAPVAAIAPEIKPKAGFNYGADDFF